jgi:CO dehydrogenase maturation factor
LPERKWKRKMGEIKDIRRKGTRIAVTGKGGSGKTMLTAILTGLLAKDGSLSVLAIDADSSINLPYTLGVNMKQTVAQIRQIIIEDPEGRAEMKDKTMTTVMEEALVKGNGFQFLAMGRPEGPGCFCSVNDLLKYGIDNLSKKFDVTLIDCEAGPEQVNRRVVNGVDDLIIVTDASLRGARVAGAIMEVVQRDSTVRPGRAGLVINRYNGDDALIVEHAEQWGLEIFGRIPDDRNISEYDSVGKPLIDLPDTCSSVAAVKEICERIVK